MFSDKVSELLTRRQSVSIINDNKFENFSIINDS